MEIKDEVVQRVIDKIIARHKQGMATYGTSMANNYHLTFAEWIESAQEEAIDFVHYLERIKQDYHTFDQWRTSLYSFPTSYLPVSQERINEGDKQNNTLNQNESNQQHNSASQ